MKKKYLVGRVHGLKEQLEAVERALLADLPCGEVLTILASIHGTMNGLIVDAIEDHIREHVLARRGGEARKLAADELVEVLRRYVK